MFMLVQGSVHFTSWSAPFYFIFCSEKKNYFIFLFTKIIDFLFIILSLLLKNLLLFASYQYLLMHEPYFLVSFPFCYILIVLITFFQFFQIILQFFKIKFIILFSLFLASFCLMGQCHKNSLVFYTLKFCFCAQKPYTSPLHPSEGFFITVCV